MSYALTCWRLSFWGVVFISGFVVVGTQAAMRPVLKDRRHETVSAIGMDLARGARRDNDMRPGWRAAWRVGVFAWRLPGHNRRAAGHGPLFDFPVNATLALTCAR